MIRAKYGEAAAGALAQDRPDGRLPRLLREGGRRGDRLYPARDARPRPPKRREAQDFEEEKRKIRPGASAQEADQALQQVLAEIKGIKDRLDETARPRRVRGGGPRDDPPHRRPPGAQRLLGVLPEGGGRAAAQGLLARGPRRRRGGRVGRPRVGGRLDPPVEGARSGLGRGAARAEDPRPRGADGGRQDDDDSQARGHPRGRHRGRAAPVRAG